MHGLPDVVSDPITDAARALNVPNVEQVFYKAAESAGFTNPRDVAAYRYNQWKHDGYEALPPYIRDFCLRSCNGSSRNGCQSR